MTNLQKYINEKLSDLELDNVQLSIFIGNLMEAVAEEAPKKSMDMEDIVDRELVKLDY